MAQDTPLRVITYDDIVNADDYDTRLVPVPEWGGAVRIQTFTKQVEMEMRAAARDATGQIDSETFEMLLLRFGVLEPQLPVDSIALLRTKNAAVVDRVLQAITELNALGPDAVKKAAGTFQDGQSEDVPVPAGSGPEADGAGADGEP